VVANREQYAGARGGGAENLRDKGKGVPDYDYVYGSVFSITDPGRELLEEIWEERRQQ
jgi:hypothetical protein